MSQPIGSMYAIHGNIYHQYTPVLLAYMPYIWILWAIESKNIYKPKFFANVKCQRFQLVKSLRRFPSPVVSASPGLHSPEGRQLSAPAPGERGLAVACHAAQRPKSWLRCLGAWGGAYGMANAWHHGKSSSRRSKDWQNLSKYMLKWCWKKTAKFIFNKGNWTGILMYWNASTKEGHCMALESEFWHTQEAASRVTGGKCAFKKGLRWYIWATSDG